MIDFIQRTLSKLCGRKFNYLTTFAYVKDGQKVLIMTRNFSVPCVSVINDMHIVKKVLIDPGEVGKMLKSRSDYRFIRNGEINALSTSYLGWY